MRGHLFLLAKGNADLIWLAHMGHPAAGLYLGMHNGDFYCEEKRILFFLEKQLTYLLTWFILLTFYFNACPVIDVFSFTNLF